MPKCWCCAIPPSLEKFGFRRLNFQPLLVTFLETAWRVAFRCNLVILSFMLARAPKRTISFLLLLDTLEQTGEVGDPTKPVHRHDGSPVRVESHQHRDTVRRRTDSLCHGSPAAEVWDTTKCPSSYGFEAIGGRRFVGAQTFRRKQFTCSSYRRHPIHHRTDSPGRDGWGIVGIPLLAQIQNPAGMVAFFGITTIPSRM